MNDLNDVYNLRIDAYTPDTIPMARLAEYLAALSGLMGEKDRVHLQGIQPGSTQLVCYVQQEAVYGVVKNLQDAPHAASGTRLARSYQRIIDLLREDSASATLTRNGDNVLIFPKNRVGEQTPIGPFWKSTSHSGVLTSIGGRDDTAHAIIQNTEGAYWSFYVNRLLAQQLAVYLYTKPIRLIGEVKVRRDEYGEWHEEDRKARCFEVLEDLDWGEAIRMIRAETAGHWPDNAMEILMALRTEDAED